MTNQQPPSPMVQDIGTRPTVAVPLAHAIGELLGKGMGMGNTGGFCLGVLGVQVQCWLFVPIDIPYPWPGVPQCCLHTSKGVKDCKSLPEQCGGYHRQLCGGYDEWRASQTNMHRSSQMCAKHIPHMQPNPFCPGAVLDLLDEDSVIKGIVCLISVKGFSWWELDAQLLLQCLNHIIPLLWPFEF